MDSDGKIKFGLSIPEPLHRAYEEIVQARVGGKEKWQIVSAALLAFIQLSEEDRDDCIARVQRANGIGGSFEELAEQAKATSAKASKIRRIGQVSTRRS